MAYELFAEKRDGSQTRVAEGLADRDAILQWIDTNSIRFYWAKAFHVVDPADDGQGGPIGYFVRTFDGETVEHQGVISR